MGEDRSPELDQVRRLLFGKLSEDEGWARIDAAAAGASDEGKMAAIERIAERDLDGELLDELRRHRDS